MLAKFHVEKEQGEQVEQAFIDTETERMRTSNSSYTYSLTDLQRLSPNWPWRSMFDAIAAECTRLEGDGVTCLQRIREGDLVFWPSKVLSLLALVVQKYKSTDTDTRGRCVPAFLFVSRLGCA